MESIDDVREDARDSKAFVLFCYVASSSFVSVSLALSRETYVSLLFYTSVLNIEAFCSKVAN